MERAEAFLRAGELDEALIALDEHLQSHPDDADALRLRIDVLIRLPESIPAALEALNALPDLTIDDYVARYGALLPLCLPGVDDALIQAYWRFPRQPALAELALDVLRRHGASDQALDLLADLPKTPHWLAWSAEFHALKGDYPIAVEHFCSAVDQLGESKDPLLQLQRATLLLKRADTYRRLKQFAEAEADYLAAELIIPDDPTIPFNRGLLIFEQGKLRRALPLCRDALDHAPEALREHMRHALLDEPRYRTLAQALLG